MTAELSGSALLEIDAETAKVWLDRGTADLLDIRETDEFRREHIEAARSCPLSRLGETDLAGAGSEVAVFYCGSGLRTRQAAAKLRGLGYSEVYALRGGISGWKAAGLATRKDRRAPISLQRQVQITAGSLVLLGVLLAWLVHPWFALLSGFVGAGLVFAGLTDTCALARLLARLPYNRPGPARPVPKRRHPESIA